MTNDPTPLLDRLLGWSSRRAPPKSEQYAIATVVVVAVGIFRALVIGAIVPWLLFVPVALMAGLLFGRGPGLYSSALATLVAAASIGSRTEPMWLTGAQWTGSVLFLLVASGIALLGSDLAAAFVRVRQLVSDREAAQATLRTVFEMAPVGLSLAAADGGSVLINEEMRRMLGRDISAGGIARYLGAGAIHEDGEPYLLSEYPQVAAVREGIEVDSVPFLIERPDRSRLRTEISSVPLRDPLGAIAGAVSVVVDVEDRELAIERQTMLIGELAHRMKNTMAMVQAIVHQSLRSAGTLAEARESVVSRFEALVRAQDRLTAADWKLTDLFDVTRGALETFSQDGRVSVVGEPVQIGARAALSFTLVLHELATNALKYGALSVPEGRIDVSWRVLSIEAGRELVFEWREVGGPTVLPPTRKGFGSRLIGTMGKGFGGRSELSYDASGVTWRVEAEVGQLTIS